MSLSPVPKKSRLDESTDALTASDDGSPSGFIRYEVAISDIKSVPIFSPKIEVLGVSWHLKVQKSRGNLQMFLCHRLSECEMWSVDASVEFTLINIAQENNEVDEFVDTFNHENSSWGFDFLKWKDVVNEEKGFIKDGKIIIEARFTLYNIIGIRTIPHIEFSDSTKPFHDVALVINGEKVYVSKQILAVHSLFFKAMFYGNFSEKNKNEMELKDIDHKEFTEMLNRIYPSYTQISDDNAEYLLKLSDRFQIKTIFDQVEKFLITSSKFSILFKLNLSDKYRLVTLQEHCLSTFKCNKNIMDLESSDEFSVLSRSAKATLLEKVIKLSKTTVPQIPRVITSDDSLMGSDDGSPSGRIRFEVTVSAITPKGIFSPVIEVLGMPWSLEMKKNVSPPSLGVFLYHRSSDSDIWSIDVAAEFTLFNSDETKNVHEKFENTFNHKNVRRGLEGISKWEDIVDEEKGFVKDGKITIEARFTLTKIIGIRIDAPVDFSDSTEPFHDVALMINGEKVYSSKQILAIHSPVFKSIFYWAEKNKEVVELKNVDREVFVDMLNLIYPSYKKITDANAESLLKLSYRFQIKIIIDQVEQFIIDSTKFNIPAKLNLSEKYRLVKLQEYCLKSFKTVKDIMDLKTIEGYASLSSKLKGLLLDKAMKLN